MTTQNPTLSFPIAALGILCLSMVCSLPESELQAEETGKVELRYKFEAGQTVRYDVTMNDDYKVQIGQDVDEPYSHQHSTKNYVVKSVNLDGSAVLQLTIESIQLEIHQNGETFKYNSKANDSPEAQPVFQAMENLVGKPHLQLTISTRGEVSGFLPLVPGDQVPKNPEQVAFDVLLRLPEEPIGLGETWREDFEIKLPIPDSIIRKTIKMQRRYTLKKLEDSLATIGVETKILSVIESPEDQMQLLRRQPSGTVVIDLERGQLVSKHLTQDNQVTGFEMGASLMHFKQVQSEKLRVDQTASSSSTPTK